jgi:hypothetical protein
VMKNSCDSGIIKIFTSNVIANLYAQVTGLHATTEFPARRVSILQRHLAE